LHERTLFALRPRGRVAANLPVAMDRPYGALGGRLPSERGNGDNRGERGGNWPQHPPYRE
jgi:hypothetical protein